MAPSIPPLPPPPAAVLYVADVTVLDPAETNGEGPVAAPPLPPLPPPPATARVPQEKQPPPPDVGVDPAAPPAYGAEHPVCLPAWSDDNGGRSSSDHIGGFPGYSKALVLAALDRIRASLTTKHVAGGKNVLEMGVEAAEAGAAGAACPLVARSAGASSAAATAAGADAARTSLRSFSLRETGLTPGGPEESEAFGAAIAAAVAAVATLLQPSECEIDGGASGQSPVARGAGGSVGGGSVGGGDGDRGGGRGSGSGSCGGSCSFSGGGGGGGSYDGGISSGGDASGTGSAGGTRRTRVYELIADIARDPPLNFSEDFLAVLKGGGRGAPQGFAGSQKGGVGEGDGGSSGGGTDECIDGYGPTMGRPIDSLMSLGR